MAGQKVRITEAAKVLGVTTQTLRNWDKSGKLKTERSAGDQRYYWLHQLERFKLNLGRLAWAWAASDQPPEISGEYYCERQDRFTSRLEKMSVELLGSLGKNSESLVSLLTLVAGEIGDNSFAHNMGNWPDVPGIFYAYNTDKRIIVLADRGRGVRATLKRVRPDIASDEQALTVAFTEVISGRDPEKRGNGLKVVRRVVESNAIGLIFRSGIAAVTIPKEPGSMCVEMQNENIRGAYVVITF